VDGIRYGAINATLDRQQGANAWLTVTLKEGKNREVRRVMEHLGLQVTRLIRTAYGPFQMGSLEEGAVREVKAAVIRDQVGADVDTGKRETLSMTKPPRRKPKPRRKRPT
jgi:23S rRNA pseudouridine2605 synthase